MSYLAPRSRGNNLPTEVSVSIAFLRRQMSDSDLSAEEEAEVADESEQKEEKEEQQLKPLGHLKKGIVWRKIEVNDNLINVKGGFNAKFELAPSVSYAVRDRFHRFVQLSKNAPWFLKGVAGKVYCQR